MKIPALLYLSLLLLPIALAASETTLAPSELDQLMKAVASYESGTNMQALRRVEDLIRQSAAIPSLRFQLENGLVKVLAPGSTFEGKRFACQQLGVLGSEISLPAIAELLKDEQTAGIACLALSTHPSPKANTILEDALIAARGLTRVQIANTLGDRRDTEAVLLLTSMLSDQEPGLPSHASVTSEAAIMALGKIATPEACAKLAELRHKTNWPFGLAPVLASLNAAGVLSAPVNGKAPAKASLKAAIEIYQELMAPAHGCPMYVSRAAFAALLRVDAGRSEKRILDILHKDDPSLKFYCANLKPVAIAGIRSLKSRSASAKFAAEMPKLNVSEQLLLIEALGSRGDSGARKALVATLKSDNVDVQQAAITALGKMGDASVVFPLIKALALTTNAPSADNSQRELLEQTLVRMGGGKKVDEAIIGELKDAPNQEKGDLIDILARRGAQSAVPVLLKETANRGLATDAFRALGMVAGAEDGPKLLNALVNIQWPHALEAAQEATAQVLSKMPVTNASALVRKALAQCKELDTRCCLVRLLSSCPDEKGLAELKTAAASQETSLRESAFQALEQWPDLGAWDTLAAVYKNPENAVQRVRALRALVRLARDANAHVDTKLVDGYKELLSGAKSDDERKLILSALAGAAHPQALELANGLLATPGVRAEAEIAVKKISEALKK